MQWANLSGYSSKFISHSGDYESGWNEPEKAIEIGQTFLKWLGRVQGFQHRLFVAGNHDTWFWNDPDAFKVYAQKQGVIVLDGEVVTLGGLRIWGSPYLYTHRRNPIYIETLPEPGSFDVMITHVPPFGILDFSASKKENIGSPALRKFVQEYPVRLHIFGHCHEGNNQAGPFHNVAMASRGKKKNLINLPRVIDINYVTA